MIDTFLSNLSSPPLLFFFLGALAVAARSDLEIPNQIAKFLSLYLLFAIGFKGGVALAVAPFDTQIVLTLGAAMVLSAVVPLYTFMFLRNRIPIADAAAIAATYGSVSAVTFVTATSYLDVSGISWGGHMVAAMALMESPAIIVGLLLYRKYALTDGDDDDSFSWSQLLREACLNGSIFLIVGSLIIGWITGPAGMSQISSFIQDLFLGVLCLFLLDMGIVAARRIKDLRNAGSKAMSILITMALVLPLLNAMLGLGIASALDLDEGDALLLIVLAASASYIAVPAAMRLVLPQANPGSYLPMSLAITFPLNILVGIPLYHALVRWTL
ncbi:sodium-dependent bicarbonate transport family permease [Candidatus Litorirhabdus singularis]|uniref:sodium-dependent bicarbonate transport family permease n=1 Tax=Candidatus Litorirhabdus singularis TaxID=2518993 RepID=UPI00242C5BC0|nr:sodium-dependent bicarbonate transport family permease [Candidatus Litorirhabdus singularis]